MLGIADEDGWVQILDSRRTGSRSLIKGMYNLYYALINVKPQCGADPGAFDIFWKPESNSLPLGTK